MKIFENPWLLMIVLIVCGGLIFSGLLFGQSPSLWQVLVGAVLGGGIGAANTVIILYNGPKWFATLSNGIIGAITGGLIAAIYGKPSEVILYYIVGGLLLGLSARFWLKYVNF